MITGHANSRVVTWWILLGAALPLMLLAGSTPATGAFRGASGKIAFHSFREGNLDIYSMNNDGTTVARLTTAAAEDGWPSWSPDGTKIAFLSRRDGNAEIYVMSADGSNQTNLTNRAGSDLDPAWSPDGSQIAFHTNRDGNVEVYVMNADGSGQTNLTNSPTSGDGTPVWSPDGTKIAYSSRVPGTSEFDIWVMNVDGSGKTNVTNHPAADAEPSWSPDGMRIAFESDRDGDSDIYVMNANGSGVVQLTDAARDDSAPDWSPDGAKVAFASRRDDDFCAPVAGGCEIYVMDSDGTAVTRLTNNLSIDDEPHWQSLQTALISALVNGLGIDARSVHNLNVILRNAQAALERGAFAAACAQLRAVANYVRAQDGKALDAVQAAQLTAAVDRLRAATGC